MTWDEIGRARREQRKRAYIAALKSSTALQRILALAAEQKKWVSARG